MKSFIFEVPRIKEEAVEKFIYMVEGDFYHEKYRINDKTIYTIWYQEDNK